MKKLMYVLLVVLVLQITACGKEMTAEQAMAATCNSTAVSVVNGQFFFFNTTGVFVPMGFTTEAQTNSCGQVMNGTLTGQSFSVRVVNGAIQAP